MRVRKAYRGIAGCLMCAAGLLRVADAVTIPEDISLEGTRSGPTGYYMTMDDREAYIERVRTDPETREAFEKIKEIAAAAVQGGSMDILACAKAYPVTKDEKYLVPIRGLVNYYEERWFTLYPHDSAKRKGIGNSWRWGIKGALVGDVEAGKAYDLVAAALPANEERAARAWLKDCLDGLREWFEADDLKEYVGTGMNTNMTSMTLGRWLEWAVAIGYEDWIDWALYNPGKGPRYSKGFVHWLEGNINDNRIWSEVPIYGRYFMYGTVPMGRYLTNYGGLNLFDIKSPDGGSVAGLMDG